MKDLHSINDEIYDGGRGGLEDNEIIQLVGLKLGEEEYAIDVLKIQEIIRTVEITTVPRTDTYVLGVMNLRGKVIPVIDLRVRFSLDKMDFDKETRIIVVRFESENIGFVVDEVTEVIRINKSMVEPTPPLVGAVGQEYILGICKYDDRLIILLDIDSVIADGKSVDSDLRRRFLGTPNVEEIKIDYDQIAENVESYDTQVAIEAEELPAIEHKVEKPVQQEKSAAPELDDLDAQIAAELAKREQETEESFKKKKIAEESPAEELDDLDALIAAELEMREKETESLHKKKIAEEEADNAMIEAFGDEDILNDVLNDALNQTTAYEEVDDHVAQSDLDSLIAAELEKRELETEELLARKKAEKKNEELDFDNFKVEIKKNDDDFSGISVEENTDIPEEISELTDENPNLIKQTFESEELDPVEAAMAQMETELDPVEAAMMQMEKESASKEAFSAEKEIIEEPVLKEDVIEENEHILTTKSGKKAEKTVESIDELRDLAKKIIDGEAVDLGIDLRGELGELLKLTHETKKRVDEIDPAVMNSKEQMPNVVQSLEMVNDTTEEATLNLMEATDRMSNFYSDFIEEINDLEDLMYKKDVELINRKLDRVERDVEDADHLGFGILHALEFQDITEQKIRKIIKSVEDIGARLGALLGVMNASGMTGIDDADTSQDDIDKLLTDFGLA